ncbi:hypothetical protein LX99_03615 [Mucilaginibacter oryzae]|uniref:Response regulatory domain-containing protein n=1 Tax=Mucilaginibacter oryzae TaxID=468058 RepID=A0A316HLS3_9SPHI|nr:hypothetical protein [Mucilaginibacter oryzae]PWK75882.1 hypothetical protein LX99_03615 [Mucilaginibacter oryzae]
MIRVRSKIVLLVAPEVVGVKLLPNNKVFKQIASISSIFPSIHEIKPNLIILDYDYLINDIEKILRRLSTNPAYKNIRICCYKNKWHSKVDPFLKALGVDHIFYAEDLEEEPVKKNIFESIGSVLDVPLLSLLAKPAH